VFLGKKTSQPVPLNMIFSPAVALRRPRIGYKMWTK